MGPARLLGDSYVPVRFSVELFDENYALGDTLFSVVGTSIDEEIPEAPFGALVCVENQSGPTASFSFEVAPD